MPKWGVIRPIKKVIAETSKTEIDGCAIGIDFGTTNSVVAYFDTASKMAKTIKIDGKELLASVVRFEEMMDDAGKISGILKKIVVGEEAKNAAEIYPNEVIHSIKRQIGNNKYIKRICGHDYQATGITAEIFKKILTVIRKEIPDKLGKVVITVPASFTSKQRNNIKTAALLAGLHEKQILLLEEPTAAAIAYKVKRDTNENILVYDFGGGTFDCVILKTPGEKREFELIGRRGDFYLGGDDIDANLVKLLADEIKKQSKELNFDVLDIKRDQGVPIERLKKAQFRLKDAAEKAKIYLSAQYCKDNTNPSTKLLINNAVEDRTGNSYNINMDIDFNTLKKLSSVIIEKTRRVLLEAVTEAGLTKSEISRIILVGGSSRLPQVREMIYEEFKKMPFGDANPDICVAEGAAIRAFLELVSSASKKGEDLEPIKAIARYNFGIKTKARVPTTLIKKGQELPYTATKNFQPAYDYIDNIRIPVYQWEPGAFLTDEGTFLFLGEIEIKGLDKKRKKNDEKVEVTFILNKDNSLNIATKHIRTGKTNELIIG